MAWLKKFLTRKAQKLKNVTGRAFSPDSDGRVAFFVVKKYTDAEALQNILDPDTDFSEKDLVPKRVWNRFWPRPTKVVEVGEVKAHRSIAGGSQIAPKSNSWYGTLGGYAYRPVIALRGPDRELYGLSPVLKKMLGGSLRYQSFGITNRHVVCPDYDEESSAATEFVQPLGARTAVLELEKVGRPELDCALLRPKGVHEISKKITDIGEVQGVGQAKIGMAVEKYGARTQHTTGTCTRTNVSISIDFGGNTGIKTLHGLDMFTYMSDRGDSGSYILDSSRNVVTLLNAGSSTVTLGIPIKKVLAELQVEVTN